MFHIRGSCGVADTKHHHFYRTGGTEPYGHTVKNVTKYGPDGFLEDLPELLTSRSGHACAGYYKGDVFLHLVAGGWSGYGDGDILTSTELFEDSKWRFAQPLPLPITGAKATTISNNIFLLGGRIIYYHIY